MTITSENTKEEQENLEEFHKNSQNEFGDICAPLLDEKYLKNARILPNREAILDKVKPNGIYVEVGTQTGGFAKKILETCKPAKLHIIDISYCLFEHEFFKPYIEQGIVIIHEGDSSTILSTFDDKYFDMIYVDGDHFYDGVKKDLEQAVLKIKDDGIIICNDYTIYSPFEKIKYGIPRALNETCINHNFEFVYMGLHPYGYHDVAIKKI